MARGGGPNMGTAAGAATGGAAGGASALHGTAVAGAGTAHHNGYTNYTSAGGTSGQHPHHDHVHGTASSGGNVKPVSAAHEQHQQHHNITAGHRVLHLLAKRPHSAFNTNRKRVRPVMDGGPDRKLRERPKSGDHRHHLHMNMTHHPNLQLTFNATADSADQHQQTFHGATSAGGAAAHALHTGGAPGSSSGAGGGPGATHHPGIATAMDYRRYMDRRAQAEKARHRRPTSSGAGGGYAQWNQTTPAGYEHMGGGGMDHVGATTRRPSTSGAGGAGTRTSSSAVGGNIHHHSDGLHHTTATSSAGGAASASGQQAQRQYGEPITLRPTGAIPHQSSGNNQHDAARPTTAPGGASKPGHANQNTASGNLNQREHDSWHQDDGAGDTYGGALANINTSTTIHDYIIGKQIGQGAYATVRLAVHKPSGKKVAIKIYEKSRLLDPQRRKSVRREIRVMDRLSHPNIVKFYEVADTSRQVFLVLEYVNGGSLHYLLKKRANRRLSEIDARMIFSQVCAGIRYCHERLVVHRDIKLENVLVQYPDKAVAHNQNLALTSSGHLDPRQLVVKLIDFGFASLVVPGKKLRVFCGTPSYMAPEIIQRKEYGGYCVDIWALGILLYAMLFGQFPFRGQSDKELYKKILKGAFTFPEGIEAEVSKNARALLVKTFVQMDVRPTIQNVVADPFLADSKGAFSYARPTSSQGSGHASSSGSGTGYVSGHQQHAGSSGGHGHLPGATHSRPSSSHGLNGMGGGGQTGIPLREEAIAKLEKLGYAREDILRQMKDENSHLSKLYTRFVKALNAWGK
eukprot:g946.t1